MSEVVKFFEKIIAEFDDLAWSIVAITDFKEVTKDEDVWAELPDGPLYDKQDDYYIQQTQMGEDYFVGTIIYPITDGRALIIHYEC